MIQPDRYSFRQQFSEGGVNTACHAKVCNMLQMVGKSFDELFGINRRLMDAPISSDMTRPNIIGKTKADGE